MAKGFTLAQVAGLMHLREEQVGALEDGDFESFKAESTEFTRSNPPGLRSLYHYSERKTQQNHLRF